jgi:hypothetical protein
VHTLGLLGVCGALASVLAAAGCGESQHQDAHEAKGTFTVHVAHASFPTQQAVAKPATLTLTVSNTGAHTVPNVTVAVTSFYYTSDFPNLASSRRPVWVVDAGPGRVANPPVETAQVDPPGGGTTSNYNVWALGPLAPRASRTFVWRVTPVKPGLHKIAYRVYAGLNGRAQAQLTGGGPPVGSFTVHIAGRPPLTHVDPQTGKVVAGPYVPPEG